MNTPARETGRERRERKHREAVERNAHTPDERRRAAREGSAEYRRSNAAPEVAADVPVVRPERPVRVPRPDFPRLVAAARGVAHVDTEEDSVGRAARRHAAYLRRTAPVQPPKRRTSDVAPRRLTDGVKADHQARAVAIGPLFALPLAAANNLVRSAEEGHGEAASPLSDQSVAAVAATDRSLPAEQVAHEPAEAASEINDRSTHTLDGGR